ncbi:hypothetical protein QJS66_12235 [Kocuria rhizophila]|nr:hypothetical protein QJS66_12235 [Kocuria rhizophila]
MPGETGDPQHAPAPAVSRARPGLPVRPGRVLAAAHARHHRGGSDGTALYLAGLSSPDKNFKEFPIAAAATRTRALRCPGERQDHPGEPGRGSRERVRGQGRGGRQDRPARAEHGGGPEQLDRGELYAAGGPESFSEDTVSLIGGLPHRGQRRAPRGHG